MLSKEPSKGYLPSNSDSWVRCFRPNPKASLRVFCFPYAGGGGSAFITWPDRLPREVELCAVQLPGREARVAEPLVTEMPSLVASLSEALEPRMDVPFAFFGHSMGGLICFELARRLRREHRRGPVHLLISGRAAPQMRERHPRVHTMPDARLLAELRKLGGTPETVLKNPELMELLLPIFRADFALCENYFYTNDPPLDCPISVFGGVNDPKICRAEFAGWRAQTRGHFRLEMCAGNHFFPWNDQPRFLSSLSSDLRQTIVQFSMRQQEL
jgi:surfactin synthase thioesterase subunit